MPQPARRANPRTGGGAPSYLDVVPVLEEARPGQALDPVGHVEPQMRQPQVPAPHGPTLRRRTARRDPRLRGIRVSAGEPPEQWGPAQRLRLRGARRQPGRVVGEAVLRGHELAAQGLQRAGPAVVKHAGTDLSRPHPPQRRTDAEPLGVLVRPDVVTEPHGAHLPAVPVAVRRDRVEVAEAMQVVDPQALDARVPVTLPYALPARRGARPLLHL